MCTELSMYFAQNDHRPRPSHLSVLPKLLLITTPLLILIIAILVLAMLSLVILPVFTGLFIIIVRTR